MADSNPSCVTRMVGEANRTARAGGEIEAQDVEMIARRLSSYEAGASDLECWAETRRIDPIAISAVGVIASGDCLQQIAAGELDMLDAPVVAAIAGFQLGVEVERRRRTAAEAVG
jgi:hypothetical protein